MAADNSRNDQFSNAPENDPSKAMDSKREVAQSNDEKTDQDFPGYPHYPAKEDIMDQRTDSHRVDLDVENLPSSRNATGVGQRFTPAGNDRDRSRGKEEPGDIQDDLNIQTTGNDADVTDEELAILDSTDGEIGIPQNVSNEDLDTDLDIPGSEIDDDMEAIGEEDEENNYYSLGGDRHEDLEEDTQE